MGQIWRLHFRPYGGKGDPALAVALCLKESVLGMGWGVDAGASESLGWEQYEEQSKASGGLNGNVRRWKSDVEEVVLFSTTGKYGPRDSREAPESRWPSERVEVFIKEHLNLLPKVIVSASGLHQTITAQDKQ